MHARLISGQVSIRPFGSSKSTFVFERPRSRVPPAIQPNNSRRSKVVGDFASRHEDPRHEVDVRRVTWEGVSLFRRIRIRLTMRYATVVDGRLLTASVSRPPSL